MISGMLSVLEQQKSGYEKRSGSRVMGAVDPAALGGDPAEGSANESTDLRDDARFCAYSAWSKRKRISLEDYVEFILTRGTDTGRRSSSRRDPGKKGKKTTPTDLAECERAAEEGWDNYVR